jgi:hypothetical protein
MKFKKIITSLICGAAILAFTGAAIAEDITLYGASAQFLFWTSAAPGFLQSKGCTVIGCAKYDNTDAIVKATCGGVDTYFRIASKASYDGICALQSNYGGANSNCTSHIPADARDLSNETTCTWGSCAGAVSTWSSCTGRKSVAITIGASDVEGDSFVQQSHGLYSGPLGGAQTDRVFTGLSTAGLDRCTPLVVPFAFFANRSVTKGGVTIDNMPRMMAVIIFSGQAWNWTDFGADFASLPIVACLRHAGSGTHATLDMAVMHNEWGASLATCANNNTSAACVPAVGPTIYFNNGSGDEMNCVNGSGAWSGDGAVGYADADQAGSLGSYPDTVVLKYNGEVANRVNIRNGVYDNFWSNQQLYFRTRTAWIDNLCTYAADPTKVPASKANYWATVCEMNYEKEHDSDYPKYVGATCPQTP